jgi:hypothetical protein
MKGWRIEMDRVLYRYECLLSDTGIFPVEKTLCKNIEGTFEIIFSSSERKISCTFDTYAAIKVIYEDFMPDYTYSNLPDNMTVHEHFGNVVYMMESDWLSEITSGAIARMEMERIGKELRHYLFLSEEDKIEVISFDEPMIKELKGTE